MKKIKLLILIGLIIVIMYLLIPIQCFVITDLEKNHIVKVIPIIEDEIVVYRYIHSVSKTPIEEYLVAINKEIALQEVRYIDQGGAGMPEYGYGDEEFENMGDYFVIRNFNRSFEEVVINVQDKYENEFIFEDSRVFLPDVIENNKRILIKIDDLPRGQIWLTRFKGG
ncbi:DUF1850 domain-containing protein [Vallitalea okinawensis]|uniref:DUF1850 domain-containing protein n=1 Tax=Vallitalea okinawensis TaxID=2078660 RepID=UPI000CFB853C|nr:DUF1850 domain-containing protein [Vallitalea okinawensis]